MTDMMSTQYMLYIFFHSKSTFDRIWPHVTQIILPVIPILSIFIELWKVGYVLVASGKTNKIKSNIKTGKPFEFLFQSISALIKYGSP